MSENLNRSNPDFSKYDSMSIGELEEILRADAQGPERDDSDVDEILYVMEVLAKKRRENGTAGKTALEAYQEFQQHYLPMDKKESKPRRKANIIPFRRIAAVAASLVLVFSLTTTANAFSFKDVWNAVVVWAQETFSFSSAIDDREPMPSDSQEYPSFENALYEAKIPISLPASFPEGYVLNDIIVEETPIQETYIAVYQHDGKILKICVRSFLQSESEHIEQSKSAEEVYSINGTSFYLFNDNNQVRAAWVKDQYECYITGRISITELKQMIDSIPKG